MNLDEIINCLENYFENKVSLTLLDSQGEVSQVFQVNSQNQKFILKVNSLEFADLFFKESLCLGACVELGINVPRVFLLTNTENYSLMMMEFIEGENCFGVEDKEFRAKIFHQLGKWGREVNKISDIKTINVADLKKPMRAYDWFYDDYINFEINITSSENDYLKLTNDERERILKSLTLLNNTDFEFVVCHGDLSLKNCIYNRNTNKLVLLDFGSSECQPKYYFEMALKWLELNYEKSITENDFLNFAEGMIGEEYQKSLQENTRIIEAYALVYALDKYRWAHDRSTKEWQDKYFKRFYGVLNILRI